MRKGVVRSPSVSAVGVRQTVLQGSADGSGIPNALSAGSGLSVALSVSNSPFLIAFAAGFDSYGQVDYVATATAQTISGLTASTTNFLYVDRSTIGTLTYSFSTLTPVYAATAPSSPATGQHWFDLSRGILGYQMKTWNGSSWLTVQRVFIGEAVTSSSAVTSVTTYAYGGSFSTGWFAITTSTNYTKNHYLGMTLPSAQAITAIFSSTSSTGASDITIAEPYASSGSNFYGYISKSTLIDNRLGYGFLTGGAGVHFDNGAGSWVTSAYYNITFRRGW